MLRRDLLLSALAGLGAAPVAGAERAIVLGQIAPPVDALDAVSQAQLAGMKLAIDDCNARGGVYGRKLEWVRLDSRGPAQMLAIQAQRLATEPDLIAWLGSYGAAPLQALAQLPPDSKLPHVGPLGAGRPQRSRQNPWIFQARADAERQAQFLAQQFATLHLRRVAVVGPAGPGGQAVAGRLAAAMTRRGLPAPSLSAVTEDPATLHEAARKLAALDPQAVLIALPAAQVLAVIEQTRALRRNPAFYTPSLGGGEALVPGMLQRAAGLAITQVLPYPWSTAQPQLVDYQRACEPIQLAVGYASLEGYLNAQVLIEGLRRCGSRPDRRLLRETLASLQMNWGGMDIDFTRGDAGGSRFLELVQIGPDGRYKR